MLIAAAALLLAASPTPPPVPLGLAAEQAHAREWSVARPTRGLHGRTVALAATVPARWRPFASCVLRRESGGTLARPQSGAGARNPVSSASGRWQLLDTQWRVHGGIAYVVSRRLKWAGMPAGARAVVRDYLQRTPIHRWPGAYQDAAAVQVLVEGGWTHWRHGDRCDALAVQP